MARELKRKHLEFYKKQKICETVTTLVLISSFGGNISEDYPANVAQIAHCSVLPLHRALLRARPPLLLGLLRGGPRQLQPGRRGGAERGAALQGGHQLGVVQVLLVQSSSHWHCWAFFSE